MKRVQVEPHLSVTGACSAEWVPIKPKTDAAFLFALIHVLLHEQPRIASTWISSIAIRRRPISSAPHGFYLRDPGTAKPLLAASLEATSSTPTRSSSAPTASARRRRLEGETAFAKLVAHMRPYSPEWAAGDLRRAGGDASAASRTSISTPPASARRSRSTARRCRSGRSP
jgi:phenylacetyl-CoA:acceptor oxidoreductase